ncbi:MAG: exonuclease SbcCD subunit D C-terminal domain-containing protein [Magnetococcus sp. XQGC-1]
MKILHTSDWHLGRSLYGRRRDETFAAFLEWLADTLLQERVEVLLLAGDVFDNATPGNRAQALYYQFLCRAASLCRHIVIIAGNHDSPAFLNAPRELLRALNCHVIGAATADPSAEVLLLCTPAGNPELIVCAVPFLRDRDLRLAEAGEGMEEKEQKLLEGIRHHYATVADLAEKRRNALGLPLPILAMGHLFTAGGETVEGDGVRALYVGSVAHVAASIFSPLFDYVALGHLHVAQSVNRSERVRYSGSPLPMGFGEARQEKSLTLVEWIDGKVSVRLLPVPVLQRLESIRGNWPTIAMRLQELASSRASVWLEIVYDGAEVISDLRERLENAVAGSELEIVRIKNNRLVAQALQQHYADETLQELEPEEVFARCLAAHEVPEEQQPALQHAYQEILMALREGGNEAITGGEDAHSGDSP